MKDKKIQILDILYMPLSLVFLYLMFRNYTQFLDISMVDETGYMELLNYNPLIYPGGYGPLYILSYKILYQFIHDFINLHYFAIISLTWLPSVAMFYFLRSRRVIFSLALFASWAFMFSSYIAAFDWWARTAHYAILFVFLFLIFTKNYKTQVVKLLTFAILFAKILAYARPELNVASYILIGFLILYVGYEKLYKKQRLNIYFSKFEKILFSVMLVGYLGMFLVWKSPTTNTGRMYFALGQHYKMNTIIWKHQERKEFIFWEETFKEKFGESRTLSAMYQNNPQETIKHVTFNIKHYFQQAFAFIPELFMPKVISPNFSVNVKWVLILLFYGLLVFKMSLAYYWSEFKNAVEKHFVSLFIVFTFAAPSVVASFVIYPREHYFIMQLPFLIYLIYILLIPFSAYYKMPSKINKPIRIAILIITLLFLTPNVKSYIRYNNFYTYEKPNYLPYIQTIRKMKIDSTVNFLSFEILPVYLGKNFRGYAFFSKQPFYDSIINAQNINMMYMSDVIQEDKRNQSDSSFIYFIRNYQKLGWQKLQLKDKWGYLIYKRELVENGK